MSWRGYETTKEAGKRWGVSSMWVSQLCKQGRVPGAGKIGGIWLIPDDAPKPEDGPDLERALCRRQPKASEIAEGITGGSSRV